MRIVVIGAGNVGRPLADGWPAAGHEVVVPARGGEHAAVAGAFSIYGWENLADHQYDAPVPPMMIAADDPRAADTASTLAADLGWDPLVVGGLEQSLHLEHMTLLWIRMVRAGGRDPHIVWARLQRTPPASTTPGH